MKKLFLSAFAVSLMLLTLGAYAQTEAIDDFMGLETEVLPELEGKQRFTKEGLHEIPGWKVKETDAIVDKEPLKGQSYSMIPWKTQEPDSWLDINNWLIERDLKDKNPDWRVRLRDKQHTELMGKILSCVGVCQIFRGITPTLGEYRSRILEGDELVLGKDSYAWVYMMDGSLMRVSAETSLSLNEINITRNEMFQLIRLNYGHVYWHPRSKKPMEMDFSPETDSGSLPLMIREANVQNFERRRYLEATTPDTRLVEYASLDEEAIKDQLTRINQMREPAHLNQDFKSKVMIVSPNATLVSRNVSFDMLSLFGGKSYFKRRSTQLDEELSLSLRGYLNSETKNILEASWHEVNESGRELTVLSDPPGVLQVTELLTKRIKTFELAREIWFASLTVPLMADMLDSKKIALNHGYALWEEEPLKMRFQFLSEYSRRIETTNLRSIENLVKKSEAKGVTAMAQLNENHYRASLNHYLNGLKTRYTSKKLKVREMNDLQYYVWILSHGKL